MADVEIIADTSVELTELEKMINAWSEKLKAVDIWVTERISIRENLHIEYGTYAQIKEAQSENKKFIKEIGAGWKQFTAVAQEWNTGALEAVNDNHYADQLLAVQTKFTTLNVISKGHKSNITEMLSRRKAEDKAGKKVKVEVAAVVAPVVEETIEVAVAAEVAAEVELVQEVSSGVEMIAKVSADVPKVEASAGIEIVAEVSTDVPEVEVSAEVPVLEVSADVPEVEASVDIEIVADVSAEVPEAEASADIEIVADVSAEVPEAEASAGIEIVADVSADVPDVEASADIEIVAEVSSDVPEVEASVDIEIVAEVSPEVPVLEASADVSELEASADIEIVTEVSAEVPVLEVSADVSEVEASADIEIVAEVSADVPEVEAPADIETVAEVSSEIPALGVSTDVSEVEASADIEVVAEVSADVPEVEASAEIELVSEVSADVPEVETSADIEIVAEVSADVPEVEASADIEIVAEVSAETPVLEASAEVELVSEVSAEVEIVPEVSAEVEIVPEVSAEVEIVPEVSAEVEVVEEVIDVSLHNYELCSGVPIPELSADVEVSAEISADVEVSAEISADVEVSAELSADVEDSVDVTDGAEITLVVSESSGNAAVQAKLDEFNDWLPTVQKRSEEGDEIGPDAETINRQIQEMKMIQGQVLQMSFATLLEDETLSLTEEESNNLKAANDNWLAINTWVNKRHELLVKSSGMSDDFKTNKATLSDFLRDVENDLNVASEIDLGDTEAVQAKMTQLQEMLTGMEQRKHDIASLVEVADDLNDLVKSESDGKNALANDIRTETANILDEWNARVKRCIEMRTMLLQSQKKLAALEKGIDDVTEWLIGANEVVINMGSGTVSKELKASIEGKQKERDEQKKTMDEVNALNEELSQNGVLAAQYALKCNLDELNDQFIRVSAKLGGGNKNQTGNRLSRLLSRGGRS